MAILKLEKGIWSFSYSQAFKNQDLLTVGIVPVLQLGNSGSFDCYIKRNEEIICSGKITAYVPSKEELEQFSNDVLDRFRNPYLEHALMSISLNSTSKYKTRVLPSVLEYIKRKNKNPEHLLFSLAALIAFYKGERGSETYTVKDDQSALDFFATQWATGNPASIVKATLANINFWGTDLTQFDGLEAIVTKNLENITHFCIPIQKN